MRAAHLEANSSHSAQNVLRPLRVVVHVITNLMRDYLSPWTVSVDGPVLGTEGVCVLDLSDTPHRLKHHRELRRAADGCIQHTPSWNPEARPEHPHVSMSQPGARSCFWNCYLLSCCCERGVAQLLQASDERICVMWGSTRLCTFRLVVTQIWSGTSNTKQNLNPRVCKQC